jgi:HEAT repeat protein
LVPDLVALLKDESVEVRLNAAEVLAALGEEPDVVFELLSREHRKGTKGTLYPLSKLGPRAVPVIVEALADPKPETRIQAATLLREIKPPATEAIPALLAARKDRVRNVREAVRSTLDTIRPGSAWEPLEPK